MCAAADFAPGTRRLIKAGTRNVAVYHVRGRYYAIDNACYHHGGPLLNGDIEDLGGHPCVKCPWHSYKITLDTGEGLYFGLEPNSDGQLKQQLKSKGRKQRTHRVDVRGGQVYCIVDASDGSYESDAYAEMAIANREQATSTASRGETGGGQPRLHSNMGAVDGSRSGAVFMGGGNMRSTRAAGGAAAGGVVLTEAVAASASPTVRTFVFEKTGVSDRRRVTPGMWVRLRLPVPDANSGEPTSERQWTVSSVRGPNGGWFSITVKNTPQSLGGSRWLHDSTSVKQTVDLVEVGGTFTLDALRERINSRRGRVLMVSGGIGITPLFAAVNQFASDPFAVVSGPPLHVAHLHCERNLDEMPFVEQLAHVHRQYHAAPVDGAPFSYRLSVHATGGAVAESFTARASDVPLQQGRIERSHIKAAIAGLRPDAPDASIVVMVCGPPAFISTVSSWAVGCGVVPTDVFSESF